MRRSATALLAAIVAVGLLVGPAAGTSLSAGSGTPCVWKKKTKRIVKHVKRHGKKRRIVRIKHYWICVPQAATPPVVTPTPPTPPDPVGPSRLGVDAFDFSYAPTRTNVDSGDFIVELNNRGEDEHNLNIAPADAGGNQTGPPMQTLNTVTPGAQTDARFDIAPGKYYLYCSLVDHESLGMHTVLTVDP